LRNNTANGRRNNTVNCKRVNAAINGDEMMNSMMAAAGIPWEIIRVSKRQQYMDALESASCKGDIKPFALLIIEESKINWE